MNIIIFNLESTTKFKADYTSGSWGVDTDVVSWNKEWCINRLENVGLNKLENEELAYFPININGLIHTGRVIQYIYKIIEIELRQVSNQKQIITSFW